MAIKKSLKKSLEEQANKNASVTVGTSKNQKSLKAGTPNDHATKHLVGSEAPIVGISLGSTINMDNYESLRVDVWLTDTAQDNETIEQAYSRVIAIVDKTLQDIVHQYKE